MSVNLLITFENLIPYYLYLSPNWLKFVPYALHTVTSNTTTYFINKNLVYKWDLRLAEFLHAFILNFWIWLL